MANKTGQNIVKLDTFTSDAIIQSSNSRVQVKSMIFMNAGAAAKSAILIDSSGDPVLGVRVPANSTVAWNPPNGFDFYAGITYDQSASEFTTGDFIFAYLGNRTQGVR